jgi:hypothetical protein
VRNATGHLRTARYADAISVSTYPSRGLTVDGFEIKVSKGDWKRELENPDKAEEIARYCDHWWVVAPAGIVPPGTVPKGWGLLEAKKSGLFKTLVAPILTPDPLDRMFLVSMLRSAHTLVEAAERRSPAEKATSDAWQKGWDEGKANGERVRSYRLEELKHLEKRVKEFKELSGIDLDGFVPSKDLAHAMKVAERLARDSRMLRTLHAAIGEFLQPEGHCSCVEIGPAGCDPNCTMHGAY